jgi:hypothetical protein
MGGGGTSAGRLTVSVLHICHRRCSSNVLACTFTCSNVRPPHHAHCSHRAKAVAFQHVHEAAATALVGSRPSAAQNTVSGGTVIYIAEAAQTATSSIRCHGGSSAGARRPIPAGQQGQSSAASGNDRTWTQPREGHPHLGRLAIHRRRDPVGALAIAPIATATGRRTTRPWL